jgi:hypothetical protein
MGCHLTQNNFLSSIFFLKNTSHFSHSFSPCDIPGKKSEHVFTLVKALGRRLYHNWAHAWLHLAKALIIPIKHAALGFTLHVG